MSDGNKKLITVKAVSELTGVSIRALRYYDEIGLLPPTDITEAGYRLYDEEALHRLQCILLYRELEFPLREISMMMNREDFDKGQALERQIALLERKREHLDNLIILAREIMTLGVKRMDFSAFDKKTLDEYDRQAKKTWGETDEYREYEQKSAGRDSNDNRVLAVGMMEIFAELGRLRHLAPSDDRVQAQAARLQEYISENYYTCSDEVFLSLAGAYAAGGSMQANIDRAGGEGTGEFACRAIQYLCSHRKR